MPTLQTSTLAFLGGGNMASAIISGLLRQSVPASNIHVSEPWEVNRNKIAALGVNVTTSNTEAASSADVVILAVKPQVAKTVCEELRQEWTATARAKFPIVVSIAAGITLQSLQKWLSVEGGKVAPVVRVMPNTPALVTEGASGAFAGVEVGKEDKGLVEALLGSVSRVTEWVDREELLDVVTGLSGMCFFFFFFSLGFGFAGGEWMRLIFDVCDRIRSRVFLRYG